MTATLEAAPRAASAFRVQREGDLAVVWFDLPGEKVNKFSSSVMIEFAAVVDELERSADIKRVVVASGKPSIFIAGADVSEFSKATSAEQAREYVRFGQQTLHRFSKLPQVTVAAVNGACLGGGCELGPWRGSVRSGWASWMKWRRDRFCSKSQRALRRRANAAAARGRSSTSRAIPSPAA